MISLLYTVSLKKGFKGQATKGNHSNKHGSKHEYSNQPLQLKLTSPTRSRRGNHYANNRLYGTSFVTAETLSLHVRQNSHTNPTLELPTNGTFQKPQERVC